MSNLLTIAIPVYERTRYFDQALESALSQTVVCPVIVSDNASQTDHFRERCALYPGIVRYHRNQQNLGMFGNWNQCARLATTPYFMVLGDDDLIDPKFCEIVTKLLQDTPKLDFVFTDVDVFTDGVDGKFNVCNAPFGATSVESLRRFAALYGFGVSTVSMVLRRSLLLKYPWPEKPHGSNDYVQFYGLPPTCRGLGVSKKLVRYRKHALSDTLNSASSLYCRLTIVRLLISFRCEKGCLLMATIRALDAATAGTRVLRATSRSVKGAIDLNNHVEILRTMGTLGKFCAWLMVVDSKLASMTAILVRIPFTVLRRIGWEK